MKYKLINKITKEEHLCDKVTIDGFDYYVSNNEQPKIDGELYHCKHKGKGIDVGNGKPSQNLIISTYSSKRNLCSDCKKVIATNNPNIDIPKVVDDVERLAEKFVVDKLKKSSQAAGVLIGFIEGYNKSQETHSNSDKDMIEFTEWVAVNYVPTTASKELKYWQKDTYQNKEYFYSTQELLQIWKEQKTKILYYE